MGSSVYSREFKAKRELDKAYERLLKNSDITNEILEMWAKEGLKIEELISQSYYDDATRAKLFGVAGAIANTISDIRSGKNKYSIVVGTIVDGAILKLATVGPLGIAFFIIDGIDLIDKLYGGDGVFSFRDRIQNAYNKLFGFSNDLPDPEALKRGILQITMPDGTVYARPLVERLGISTDGGFKKDDVLFGGSGNDKLIGTWNSSDLLIGGDGYDRYEATHKNIIKDSDGKGIVYFGDKLTGGKYNKEKGVYISDDGLVEYKLSGRTLSVKRGEATLTIENYDKDESSLGIALLEQGEISINVNDRTKNEGDEGEQFLPFNISVSGDIPQGEYAIVEVKGKYYLFGKPAKDDTAAWEYINSLKIEGSNHYFHTWQGNEEKEEDKKFTISGNVVKSSQGLKVKEIISGNGKIIDDDKDDKQDPEDVDPIIIDLNKNKITSTKLNNTIYFDHDNNNFKEASSWIDKGDAFLALDKNSNGLIDNGNELFGNHTISNTRFKYTNNKATNGFEALKAYDLNSDNVIDSKDEIYDKLLLWKDSNQNAITDKGELIKLKDSGIVSIDLNYKNTSIDEKGNTIKQSSTITFEDGTTTIANDVWFKVNLDKTKQTSIDDMLKDTLINLNKRQDEPHLKYFKNVA